MVNSACSPNEKHHIARVVRFLQTNPWPATEAMPAQEKSCTTTRAKVDLSRDSASFREPNLLDSTSDPAHDLPSKPCFASNPPLLRAVFKLIASKTLTSQRTHHHLPNSKERLHLPKPVDQLYSYVVHALDVLPACLRIPAE